MSRKSKWMILPWNSVKSLVLNFWKKWNLPIRRMFVRSSNLLRGKPDTVGWGVHARWTGQSVSSSQSLSCVRLFATPWIAARQASLSNTNSRSLSTHVHWVSDAIQPSHPLSSPSPLALNLSQHQGLFKWVSSSHQVPKVLEFQLQHQPF